MIYSLSNEGSSLKAIKTPNNKATVGSPIKTKKVFMLPVPNIFVGNSAIDFRVIKSIGTTIGAKESKTDGKLTSFSPSSISISASTQYFDAILLPRYNQRVLLV